MATVVNLAQPHIAADSHVPSPFEGVKALRGITAAANTVPYFTSATAGSVLSFADEDDMTSDSATAIASQQSIKAYVDAGDAP